MQIGDMILASAQAARASQRADGSFPPGHNGPYHDPETPVRNTGHWLVTLCKAYELGGDAHLKEAAWRAARYLLSPEARPMQATFHCRRNAEKDFSNGLIGQAWVIESLVLASETLGDISCRELAEQVFLVHPFDSRVGLWQRVNVDGSYSTFDMTYNHQLWFAAAGAMLDSDLDSAIGSRVVRFLDQTRVSHLRVARSGRIIHHVRPLSREREIARRIYSGRRPLQALQEKARMVHKEIGYHAFNLYAFSILRQRIPLHPLWQSNKFMSLLHFVNRKEYIGGLENNRFGYPYNPVGIEVAFGLLTFADRISGDVVAAATSWLGRQFNLTYDHENRLMQRDTEDPETLSARIYEATRLSDLSLRASCD